MEPELREHILVPTDFGDAAWAAFRRACDLGRPMGARLTLLHVKPRPRPKSGLDAIGLLHAVLYSRPEKGAVAPTLWPEIAKNDPAHESLNAIAGSDWSLGVDVETYLTQGDVAAEVLRVAAELRVTLTVMGVGRRDHADGVTARVLREASGPVMLVPPRQKSGYATVR